MNCGKPQPAPAAGWTCPDCGTQNTGKFCMNCGKAKPAAACPNCGYKPANGVLGKFCPECGTKLG